MQNLGVEKVKNIVVKNWNEKIEQLCNLSSLFAFMLPALIVYSFFQPFVNLHKLLTFCVILCSLQLTSVFYWGAHLCIYIMCCWPACEFIEGKACMFN